MKQSEFPALVKQQPHWRVNITPVNYVKERLVLSECLENVQKATVHLRGWDYPHLNRRAASQQGPNWVASGEDFLGHLEYWRMYQSGQFVHLMGIRELLEEAWADKLRRAAAFSIETPSPDFDWNTVPGFLEVVNTIYLVTEIFEFAARLAPHLKDTEAISVQIGMHRIEGFVLAVDDVRRS